MTTDILETIALGSIGVFWPLVDGKLTPPEIHGAIRRDDQGYWVVDLERSSPNIGASTDGIAPDALVGVLPATTIFLSDKNRSHEARPWSASGQRLEVVRIWFETAVTDFDVETIDSDGIVSAEAVFPNQMRWAAYEMPEFRGEINQSHWARVGHSISQRFPRQMCQSATA